MIWIEKAACECALEQRRTIGAQEIRILSLRKVERGSGSK